MILTGPFTFTFTAPGPLSRPLTFTPAPHPSSSKVSLTTSRKRSRSLHDADTSRSRKKRRLRLLLSTSRLSRPFSKPASHIVDRGSCKVAIWASQKHLSRGMLRKAALLNSLKQRVQGERMANPNFVAISQRVLLECGDPLALSRAKADDGQNDGRDIGGGHWAYGEGITTASPLGARDRSPTQDEQQDSASQPYMAPHHVPIPPSPPGPSNYDALDEEDEYRGYAIPSDDDDQDDYSPHPAWATAANPLFGVVSHVPDVPPPVERLPPTPSPSPPKSERSFEEPVISPNRVGPVAWKQMHETRPPSPPDDCLLQMVRERQKVRQVREGGVWTGFG